MLRMSPEGLRQLKRQAKLAKPRSTMRVRPYQVLDLLDRLAVADDRIAAQNAELRGRTSDLLRRSEPLTPEQRI